MNSNEITFRVAAEVFVTQFGARDEMHPTRMVLTTYLADFRDGGRREEIVGTNGFGHGLDLTQATADSQFVAYEARKTRPFRTPAERRAARLAAL